MNVQNSPLPQAPQRPAAAPTKFSYNAQDPQTVPNDTATINASASNGEVSTDSVLLDNKKAIFVLGRLVGLRDDANYKLSPNADGAFEYPTENPGFTGANAFGAAAKTVDKYNQVLGELTGKKIEWSFGREQLGISPETGEWPNAFYARQFKGVHFFNVKDTSTGDSGEVVSHEVGHAVLDAIRPGYLQGTGAESGAFHEAFGDALAMLMTLQSEKSVDAIVAQTNGGDLSSQHNMLSDMGEGFGKALGLGDRGIRTAFNSFTYKDPASLPERGDKDNLGHEVHDFARLWAGAFYDVLDGIADANRAAGMSPKEALLATGEEGMKLLVAQMENSSAGSETTKDMAQHLSAGDAQFNGGKRQDLIRDVMVKRELMPAGAELFKSETPVYSGKVVAKEITFGEEFGQLAGVTMSTLVDQPVFGFAPTASGASKEAEKGVKLMLTDDKILFTDKAPDFGDLFKENGEHYTAYVAPNADGQRELVKVPIAVCDFAHGPDSNHTHAH